MPTPIRPVTMKAKRQSQVTASQITRGGATMAPTELPVLNQPVATERSLGGNQRVEVLTPDGMAAASLTPSKPRKKAIDCQLPENAWSAAAVPQSSAAMAYPSLRPMKSVTKPATRVLSKQWQG